MTMSLFLNVEESNYTNDNEPEGPHFSESENEDYQFKYMPANHFKYIVKDVRRQRCREEEEDVWASFVRQQEMNGYNKNCIQPSVHSIKQLLDEGMKEADKELRRVELDTLPDRSRKECGKTSNNKKKRTKVNNIRDANWKKMPIMKDMGTGSTNLLLTIPEEENACVHQRRLESGNVKSYTRKSCSALSQKKRFSKQPYHATNGVEYNSSPENSARCNGVIYIRPDPFTMHKILTMQRKVCDLLDEIAYRLGNIPPPDGIKDLQKRQQCVAEFAIRFSRNYLYDLNRYVKDIQKHMCVISPRAVIKPNDRSIGLHMHAIEQKLLAAHQLLLHALIAYCKHIPSSILKGHSGKFREILQVVIDLKTMCDRLHLNYLDSGDTDVLSLGKDIENKCNVILSKLKLHLNNDLDTNKTSSMASFNSYSINNKKRLNRKQFQSNRLSMYSSTENKIPKSNFKSKNTRQKDKQYSIINMKKASNDPASDRQYPSTITLLSSKDGSQTAIKKHKTYTKEEEIKTVMDMLPIDSDNSSNSGTARHNSAMLTRRISKSLKIASNKSQEPKQSETIEDIVKNTCTNNDNKPTPRVTTITEKHLSTLVPIIADLMSLVSSKQNKSETEMNMKTLVKVLEKYQQLPKSTKITSYDTCPSSTHGSYKCEHLKTNRTRNNDNMRLLCLSSDENASQGPRYCDASCQADRESLTELPDFETKMMEAKRLKDLMIDIELDIPEETEANFHKYKNEYQRTIQSIPMYSSNTRNKPWDIVAWISDKLVDELITEIAKELQIDDVIQKLFELEFQEF
ncbi:uncharacterized protein LOC109852014 isoform X2 [Pseudomyrmex gracilis]|uniref:uncharacterized protein LOC109852014 isoform X2 n=1 Tax=Pseudomyrmex gracilis TaxID=219809 RepID=UPI000995B035|nr:uncharacterized protein LOC109852014 isoform X2 [Pseudomyrmex gracilis]